MQFSSTIVAALTLALAAAQGRLSFTTLPSEVEAGETVNLEWTGGDNSPVTITLRKGMSDDLQTIDVITGSATGNSFEWTPSENLVNGDDYALEISQGVDDSNYTGLFSLSGGRDEDDSSSGYPTGTSSASASMSASASSSAESETTVTRTNTSSRASTVYATGSAPSASATGSMSVSRNTTFSSATPTRSAGFTASETPDATTTESSPSQTSEGASEETSEGAASHMEVQFGAGFAAILAFAALF